MRLKYCSVVLCLLSAFALGQNPGANSTSQSKQANIQAAQEEQFQTRRENFTSGRQLLQDKGVPFDPDELLRDDWAKNLKATLDAMPEMHEARCEKAPLKGAYLADTLYLPEKVQLSGHTIIVVNHLVFEGKNAVIKGPYDLHVFPAKPVVLLGTTLAEILRKKPELLNVKFDRKPVLPPFRLIQDVVPTEKHVITLDTSGPEPQWVKNPPRRPAPNLRTAAWNGFVPILQSGSQNTSGDTGPTGQAGTPGAAGAAGNSPAKSPNGSCTGTLNGTGGTPGGEGVAGANGGNGIAGGTGGNAGAINVTVPDTDINAYNYIANGGAGGQGGVGGDGGRGGDGGKGGDGGDGVACGCQIGEGGDAGHGGNGSQGGIGGNGGNGGNGGAGGSITVSLPYNSTGPGTVRNVGGTGGPAGGGGVGGSGGNASAAGTPGNGASACGVTAASGGSNFPGSPGAPGNSGNGGTAAGQNGPNGTQNIIRRPAPSGGGGGGPCGASGCGGCTFVPMPGAVPNGAVVECDPGTSPIIIDTEGEGFHLTSVFTGVTFDIAGTGHPVQIAWTDAHFHNAFLALPGSDGLVHNGKELFGNFTPQLPSDHPNGFLALAQFDKPENGGNGDGMIDDRDEVFSRLRLWIDENHDGICQPNELHRLPELGIYSLALNYVESRRTDDFGNQFRYKARVNPGQRRDPRDETPTGDPGRWAYDVFFVTK